MSKIKIIVLISFLLTNVILLEAFAAAPPPQPPLQTVTPTPASSSATSTSTSPAPVILPPLWLAIALAGMFGGLMFGMKDKQLILPHTESKYIFAPGFIADMFFGLAGGYIIFVAIPGIFNYFSEWDFIKALSIAFVGGYGGRALVEKVLQQQMKDLEQKVQTLEDQKKKDGDARAMITRYFEADPDKPPVDLKALTEALKAASDAVKVDVFNQAREFRKKAYDCDDAKSIAKTIPIIEAMIESDTDELYHRNFGELGFALKDQLNPDWKRAEQMFSKAIDVRDNNASDGFLTYEFNRAMCRIHLNANRDEILKDLIKALGGEKVGDWIRTPDPKRAKDLLDWFERNKTELQTWFTQNNVKYPPAPVQPASPGGNLQPT